MKESKLSPFDGDLLAMIADITKVEPKVTENDNKFIVDVQPELTIPGKQWKHWEKRLPDDWATDC